MTSVTSSTAVERIVTPSGIVWVVHMNIIFNNFKKDSTMRIFTPERFKDTKSSEIPDHCAMASVSHSVEDLIKILECQEKELAAKDPLLYLSLLSDWGEKP